MKKEKKELTEIKIPDYFKEDVSINTGIIPLNEILKGGMIPGQLVQLIGESNVGKTTMALQISYSFCYQNKNVLYIDTKNDVDRNLIDTLELTKYLNNKFFYIRKGTSLEVEKILDEFISTKQIDLIVIDSIASLTNSGYLNLDSKGLKSDNLNTNAGTRPINLVTNKLKQLAIEQKICLLFINEYRNSVERYGTRKKEFGPKNLKYQTTYMISINHTTDKFKTLSENGIGELMEFEVIKGRVPP